MKETRLDRGLFLAFCAVCGGCIGDSGSVPAPSHSFADSAGIEVISLQEDAFQGLPIWVPEAPTVLVGADESEPSGIIGLVADAALFYDGSLVVGDALARHLVVFSNDGSFVRTIGREGSGPGDFQAVTSIATRGDTVLVLDRSLRRITRYHKDNTFLSSQQLATPTSGSTQYRYGKPLWASVYAFRIRIPQGFDPMGPEGLLGDSMSLEIVRMTSDSVTQLDSLGHSPAFFARVQPEDLQEGFSQYGSALILASPLPGLLLPTVEVGFSDSSVVLGFADRFELKYLDPGGRPYRIVRAQLDPPRTGDINLDLLVQKTLERNRTGTRPLFERMAKIYELPNSLPHFYGLLAGDKGEIWLRMQPAPPLLGGTPAFRWARLSEIGVPIGYCDIPASAQVMEAHEDHLLVLLRDGLDVERVAVLPLVPSVPRKP